MTDDELMDALDGLFAYDTGSIGSGIKDEQLRKRVIAEIHADIGEHELFSKRVSRLAREMFLTDEMIAQGYGLADAQSFADWLDNEMRGDM